jgi:hypothetical protein
MPYFANHKYTDFDKHTNLLCSLLIKNPQCFYSLGGSMGPRYVLQLLFCKIFADNSQTPEGRETISTILESLECKKIYPFSTKF